MQIYSDLINEEGGDVRDMVDLERRMWAKITGGPTKVGNRIPWALVKKVKIQLPYLPEIINYNSGCQGLKKTDGLYIPCGCKVVDDTVLCQTCTKSEAKYGLLEDRGLPGHYMDPEDKHEITYGTWLAKKEKTIDDVNAAIAEAGFDFTIPESYLAVNSKRVETKRRPGRPGAKKDAVTESDDESDSSSSSEKPKKSKATKAQVDSDDESESEKPKAKKPKAKKSDEEKPKKAKKSKSDDESEKPKKASKAKKSDDEEEPKKSKAKKTKSDDESEKPKKASKAKKTSSDDESETEKPKKASKAKKTKSDDESEPKKSKAKKPKSDDESETKKSKAKKPEPEPETQLNAEEFEEDAAPDETIEIDGEKYILRNNTVIFNLDGEWVANLVEGEIEWR